MADERVAQALAGEISVAEVAAAYVRYQRGAKPADDPDWWGVEVWQDPRWAEDEGRLRDGMLALVDAAEDDETLDTIGAAEMEDFIYDDESRIEWIERHAADSDKFRRVLANVYVWGHQKDEVSSRIERAAGVRLPRPIGWDGP